MLLNTYFEISINRRTLMKPRIDRRYHQLCNINENIGDNKLFEDVGNCLKHIKTLKTLTELFFKKGMKGFNKHQMNYAQRGAYFRSRVGSEFQMRGQARGSSFYN